MKTPTFFGRLFALYALLPLTLAQRLVSISSDIPSNGHDCLQKCIFSVYTADIATALECGTPVENACYCATATASASVASSWINRCASSRCFAGDLTRDISSMRSIYAGYCVNAGFEQPIISEWYTAAEDPKTTQASSSEEEAANTAEPSNTGDSTAPETSTKVTLVTETAKTDPGSGATKSRVIVEQTSTVFVNSEGSVIPDPTNSLGSSKKTKELGIGIGVGVGVALILVAAGVWFWLRKRKQRQFQSRAAAYGYGAGSHPPPPEPSHTPDPPTQTVSPISSPVSRIGRKAVPSPMSTPSPFQAEKTELSGQHVTREVSGTEIHTFSDVTPSPPVPVPGQHEMWAHGRTENVSEHPQSAPPYELGRSDPRYEVGQSDPRYELAGR